MELGSGIAHSGCQKTCEIPVNSGHVGFESGNAGADPRGCLDLLKGLDGPEAASQSEGSFRHVNAFERWGNQFSGYGLREPVGHIDAASPSSQIALTAGGGNGHVEPVALTKTHDMDSIYWDFGVSCVAQIRKGTAGSEAKIHFTPVTPGKNKAVLGSEQADVVESEVDRINRSIGQETDVGSAIGKMPVEECFAKHSVDTSNSSLPPGHQVQENAGLQAAEINRVCSDSSTPVTPDKCGTVRINVTDKGYILPCHERLEANAQKESSAFVTTTEHVDTSSSSFLGHPLQQESQKLVVEESQGDNQQSGTPHQKSKRKKIRPKVIIEGKKARQRKTATPKPVTTPEVPRVKRKYVRKQKKDLGGTTNGTKAEHASNNNVQQSAKRVLNFDVDPSPQVASGIRLFVNPVHEESKPQANVKQVRKEYKPQVNVVSTPQPSRRYVLRENLKALARRRDESERQKRAHISEAQGFSYSTMEIKNNERSKGEQNDAMYDNNKGSFDLYNGLTEVPVYSMYNGFYSYPLPLIPEQCKRKRTKTGTSEHHHSVSSSLLPSSSNEVPSFEDGQKALACMPAEPVPRHNQAKIKFSYASSPQVQNGNLIAQANAMCYSQLPSSLSYYRNLASDGTRTVIEATASRVPRRRTTTKKGQTPEVNRFPLEYPLQSKIVSSSYASLHSTFSQTNILELVDYLVQKLICLNINGIGGEVFAQSIQNENALVIYNGGGTMVPYDDLSNLPKRRKPRARVDLDSETNRVWLLLMGTANVDAPEGTDAEKEKWWEEERRVFQGRAESFIARMHLVQGDRRFSPWKGSVVDSVVGVFLTQNVSDHLSSSAFMNLAAKFPIQRTVGCGEVKIPSENGDIYLVEFDEYMKEHERVNRHPPISQDVIDLVPEDAQSTEDKEILRGVESNGEDPESGVITTSNSPIKMPILQFTTESINSEDSEYIKSLDSTAINLNSVASSQNSSDSPVKEYNISGTSLQSQIDLSHLEDGKMCHDLPTSTSFTRLLHLQLAASNMLNFSPEETAAGVTSEQEFPCDQDKTMPGHIYKAKDASLCLGRCDSNVHKEHNDSTGVPCASSAIPNIYQYDYRRATLEKADGVKENPSTSSATTLGVIDSCNIGNSCIGYCTKDVGEATGRETSGMTSHSSPSCDSHAKVKNHFDGSQGEVHSEQHSCNHNSPPLDRHISFLNNNSTMPLDGCVAEVHQSSARKEFQGLISRNYTEASALVPSNGVHESQQAMSHRSITSDGTEFSCARKEVKTFTITTESNSKAEKVHKELANAEKPKRKRVEKTPSEPVDWDLLRKQVHSGVKKERSRETMDSVDWEAIRYADVSEISDCIRERGMNNRLAQRIKEFLDRLVKDHGSIDLEWLKDIPPDKVKDYLLSFKGLGLKSVECVRLLTLHHLAFPVDTNVGRICVRLGWVPLQPLPESLQLHLLEMYPILETIQKYLWPRLCKLDQRMLYELHYQMITFGKVFCTKSKPNCNACPMRGECKHFASAFASARLALPGPEEKGLVTSTIPAPTLQDPQANIKPMALPQPENIQEPQPNVRLMALPQPEVNQESQPNIRVTALPQQEISPTSEECAQSNCEPIIEEPATPEPDCLEVPETEIEELFYEDPDEIPTIKLNIEKFTENLQNIMQESNMELQEADISKALVALTPDAASIPQPKLKNVSRLRTEHQVYELPDSHPLVEGLDPREPDDPSPYLLAIWSPGETAQSMELPQPSCSSQVTGVLCNQEMCSACSSIREARAQIVRGTFLIPCRTAMRGSFPLNGTYFQVNEVFADHCSSLNPIDIPRQWIWNLPRRTVYFGTSVPTIFKGLTTEAIQQCFWRGFVCVRGFDRETRAPRPLMARLHFPASKVQRNKKANAKEKQGQ